MNKGLDWINDNLGIVPIMAQFNERWKEKLSLEMPDTLNLIMIVYPDNKRFSIPNLKQLNGEEGWLPNKDNLDKSGYSFFITLPEIHPLSFLLEILKVGLKDIDILPIILRLLPNGHRSVEIIKDTY
jgi:hypothetical protein